MTRKVKAGVLLWLLTLCGYSWAQTSSVEILSAVLKDVKISGAQLTLQRYGETSVTGITDAQGRVTFTRTFADNSDTLLVVRKPGFSQRVVNCPCDGMSYALSPVMSGLESVRVVLTWDVVTRTDLDSHLVYPGNHIFSRSKVGNKGTLDVDASSRGPETITLSGRVEGYTYVYAVHNVSDTHKPQSTRLSSSGAKALVYIGESLVRAYSVPGGKAGNLWTVFKITPSGEFVDINRVEGISVRSTDIAQQLAPGLRDSGTTQHNALWSQADRDASRKWNLRGEEAYQRRLYDLSIYAFTESVNLWADNGKAFGNLGQAYLKVGRMAEALWANRQALSLANGPEAAVMRAYANYNLGQVYETTGDYRQALKYYQAARNEKESIVYDYAITRVQALIR